MLAESPQLYYVFEPFNPGAGAGRDICDAPFERFFTYISADNESAYYPAIRAMVEGRYNWRRGVALGRPKGGLAKAWRQYRAFAEYRRNQVLPLIKDPIALVSTEWMATRFDIDVVVMVRHPAAFVSSMKRMNWPFQPRRWALSQPALMRDFLEPYRAELEALDRTGGDIIDQASLLWKVLAHVVAQYRERHPDWIYLRHEDISLEPVAGFETLYGQLGLDFSEPIRCTIENYSAASNPNQAEGDAKTIQLNSRENISSWKKRLSLHEIDRIRFRVEGVCEAFYPDADW